MMVSISHSVSRTFNLAANDGFENLVVNAGKVFANVALQNITMRTRQLREVAQRAMRAKSGAIGIESRNERAFKDGCDDVAKRVMHDAITIRRG